jgi:spermidine synthase
MAKPARSIATRRPRDRFHFFFGPDSKVLEQRHSEIFGGRLAVVDQPRGSDIRRCLASLSDTGLILQQSAMSMARPERLVFAYEHAMALAVAVTPLPRAILQLGLGGGAMLRFLAAYFPNCAVTAVERDPTVLAMAQRHFRLDAPIILADAIDFVAQTRAHFDAILVDIYGGGGFCAPPLRFWRRCNALLAKRGCVAINWAEARDKGLYEPHAHCAAELAERSYFVAPDGFKDNVVQLCSADPELDRAKLRERAAWLGRKQRRKSILDRAAILDDFP